MRHSLVGEDLLLREFGRLLVVRSLGVREGHYYGKRRRAEFWLCLCSCGEEVEVAGYQLLRGKRKYCDRMKHKADWVRKKVATSHHRRLTYTSWLGMKKRCLDQSDPTKWAKYGGRGIRVCERWGGSFEAFVEDMGLRPSVWHSIERRDGAGHYEPGNCCWATTKEQTRNKRTTRWVEWKGERRKLVG